MNVIKQLLVPFDKDRMSAVFEGRFSLPKGANEEAARTWFVHGAKVYHDDLVASIASQHQVDMALLKKELEASFRKREAFLNMKIQHLILLLDAIDRRVFDTELNGGVRTPLSDMVVRELKEAGLRGEK